MKCKYIFICKLYASEISIYLYANLILLVLKDIICITQKSFRYKQRMQEMLDEEDLQDNERYAKIIQDQAAHDEKILGVGKILSPAL